MKLEPLPNLFQITFIGEYVEIIAKFYQTYKEESDTRLIESTAPASIKGYLLEFDDEYYYLGNEPNAVNRVIRKTDVSYIEIVDEDSAFEKILDDFPIPEDENESN